MAIPVGSREVVLTKEELEAVTEGLGFVITNKRQELAACATYDDARSLQSKFDSLKVLLELRQRLDKELKEARRG